MLPGMFIVQPGDDVAFLVGSSLIALLLPLAIFAISAFSVPLLYYRRASLWPALRLSVAAVLSNLAVSAVWTLWLSLPDRQYRDLSAHFAELSGAGFRQPFDVSGLFPG